MEKNKILLKEIDMGSIKYKLMSKERLLISFDRLTRFKNTDTKYTRVFSDIVSSYLTYPKFKIKEFEDTDKILLVKIAEKIINHSLTAIYGEIEEDFSINGLIKEYEISVFKQNNESKILLENKINYKAVLKLLEENSLPINLKWLKFIIETKNLNGWLHGLRYPIRKLVICEGITEELLLPVFSKLLGFDFDKNGIQILSAGGKNQVVKTFYKFSETLNIPIFVLLDSDAVENCQEITPRLRKSDEIYLLKHGEFEDCLPISLIQRTLEYSIENISQTPETEPDKSSGMVHYLEEFYRNRGVHDFKKAEFAHAILQNIHDEKDVSEEFRNVIRLINN